MANTSKKIIIIGAGASGYFVAANLPRDKYEIIMLEKSSKVLSKVKISGGGRCNVTHGCFDNNLLVENYPRGSRELKSVFSRFSVKDTIDWFEKRNVKLKIEDDGRMFPVTNDSFTIVNCLRSEADKNNVQLRLNAEVVEVLKKEKYFEVKLRSGEIFDADYVIIASGGSAKNAGYGFLGPLNINIIPPLPSLFTFNIPGNEITKLMGLSVANATVKIDSAKLEERGPLLITHWGLSGPAILKLSAYGAKKLNDRNYDFTISISWINEDSGTFLQQLSADKKRLVSAHSHPSIPSRLWKYLVNKAGISENMQWANVSKKNYSALIEALSNDKYHVKGKTTFKEEFVTCGGVDLKEVDFTTMQSRKFSGLFFTGEVLDVDGITGGFNFQHAWATAFIAANTIKNTD